jgi:hypothetical protein
MRGILGPSREKGGWKWTIFWNVSEFRSSSGEECQLRRVNILGLDLDGSSRTWMIAQMMREETNDTSLGGLVR